MSQVGKNVVANFAGQAWTAGISLVFVPVYIRLIGIESYGIIGVYTTIQLLLGLLDMGLGTTLNREIARRSVQPDSARELRDLVRTVEVLYWGMAVVIAGSLSALIPRLAHGWLKIESLDQQAVVTALTAAALAMAVQWPSGMYRGGLQGLQRQVLLSTINISMATIQAVGAVVVLAKISATITAYFWWQLCVSALQTVLTASSLWTSMPRSPVGARFRVSMLRELWRFAAGMSAISVVTLTLTQMDKVILSKMLPLATFGYYTLASSLAAALYKAVSPVYAAVFPRLAWLVAARDQSGAADLYHRSCQAVAVLVIPVALVIAVFPQEVLRTWTGSAETAQTTAPVLSLLTIGNALYSLLSIPYALQIAHGWLKLPLGTNAVAVAVAVPLVIWTALTIGMTGPPLVWLGLNATCMLTTIAIMHTRLLTGERRHWYLNDVARPLVAAVVPVGLARLLLSPQWDGKVGRVACSAVLLGVLAAAFAAALLATPAAREWLRKRHTNVS